MPRTCDGDGDSDVDNDGNGDSDGDSDRNSCNGLVVARRGSDKRRCHGPTHKENMGR
jgi:hypothetical protein